MYLLNHICTVDYILVVSNFILTLISTSCSLFYYLQVLLSLRACRAFCVYGGSVREHGFCYNLGRERGLRQVGPSLALAWRTCVFACNSFFNTQNKKENYKKKYTTDVKKTFAYF